MFLTDLQRWEIESWRKRIRELKEVSIEIKLENISQIVNFMSFENRSHRVPEDCICYKKKEPCHSIADLNCFVCSCPNYISHIDEGGCKLRNNKGSRFGRYIPAPARQSGKIWDCSDCSVGHHQPYVFKFLEKNLDILREMDFQLNNKDFIFLVDKLL